MNIPEYIRGELSPEESEKIEKLLKVDGRAMREYDEWKEFFEELSLLSRYTHKPKSRRWLEAIKMRAEIDRYNRMRRFRSIGILTGVVGGAAALAITATLTYLAIRRR